MIKILCPSCFKGHVLLSKENGLCKCDNCGVRFVQTGPNSVKFASEMEEWIPCGKANNLAGNAEYQQEMLEQSKKDEDDRYRSHMGCQ